MIRESSDKGLNLPIDDANVRSHLQEGNVLEQRSHLQVGKFQSCRRMSDLMCNYRSASSSRLGGFTKELIHVEL